MQSQQLYIKKQNGRYQKIPRATCNFDTLPTDAAIAVVNYDENAKAFIYHPLDVKDEAIKMAGLIRMFKNILIDTLIETAKPALSTGVSWGKKNEKTLTPEQAEAWSRLKSLMPRDEVALLYNSNNEWIDEAVDRFLEKTLKK